MAKHPWKSYLTLENCIRLNKIILIFGEKYCSINSYSVCDLNIIKHFAFKIISKMYWGEQFTRYHLFLHNSRKWLHGFVKCDRSLTFVWHVWTGFEEQSLACAGVNFLDVITQSVTAVLSAVQTVALIEGRVVAALVGHNLLVFVQQGVNEEMHSALMGTLHCLLKSWS